MITSMIGRDGMPPSGTESDTDDDMPMLRPALGGDEVGIGKTWCLFAAVATFNRRQQHERERAASEQLQREEQAARRREPLQRLQREQLQRLLKVLKVSSHHWPALAPTS